MELIRKVQPKGPDGWRDREWLVANGLGGYASGPLLGPPTRRYHGLLIAPLPAPLGRTVMLNHLAEELRLPDGRWIAIDELEAAGHLREFRLEWGLPVWTFAVDGHVVEKRLLMPHLLNATHLTYRCLTDASLALRLRPWIQFRGHEDSVDRPPSQAYALGVRGSEYEVTRTGYPTMRLHMSGDSPAMILDGGRRREICYRVEADRGYPAIGTLWSPGSFETPLGAEPVTLIASAEPWHDTLALTPGDALAFELERRRRLVRMAHPALRDGARAELLLAADAFVVSPRTRITDAARARAEGDDVRTVIAGYHWFTDWGRDTMISLEGLTLATGRVTEAGWIIRTFAHYVRDGLIPNMFPEGNNTGLYHTADATLWFFHALDRYLTASGDLATLELVMPKLDQIIDCHLGGTRFGIGVDPADGLLRQGQAGYQLTWMDAKVEDWVVTPRRGKAVEINALWYNALVLMAQWCRRTGRIERARALEEAAERARQSFNRRFWNEATGHLFDVVDGEQGDDPACRPNQVLSISLPNPVLAEDHWQEVVAVARDRLLTPMGLRSLAPGHPDYKSHYFGNLRARDAAYHQGTVWAWLMGPFVDAHLKAFPEEVEAPRRWLEGMLPHLDDFGIGSVAEIFDAEPPYTPRGCIAQAWSVAEWLRCWVSLAATEQVARSGIADRRGGGSKSSNPGTR